MRPDRPNAPAMLALALIATGLGLCLAPPSWSAALRTAVHDGLSPGYRALAALRESGRELVRSAVAESGATSYSGAPHAELAAWELRCRRAELRAAALRERLEHQSAAKSTEPLLTAELLEARILGDEAAALLRGGQLVATGSADGVHEESLVTDSGQPLLDQGEGTGIAEGEPVYAGRVVVGRIERAGRWVSSLKRVTDAGYTDRVRLARPTAEGLVFGAQGILRGDGGRHCRLELTGDDSVNEPVSVGDEVYTAPQGTALPSPMYYGKVVTAELEPGAARWTILVEPAAPAELGMVRVVRSVLNPARVSAN